MKPSTAPTLNVFRVFDFTSTPRLSKHISFVEKSTVAPFPVVRLFKLIILQLHSVIRQHAAGFMEDSTQATLHRSHTQNPQRKANYDELVSEYTPLVMRLKPN